MPVLPELMSHYRLFHNHLVTSSDLALKITIKRTTTESAVSSSKVTRAKAQDRQWPTAMQTA